MKDHGRPSTRFVLAPAHMVNNTSRYECTTTRLGTIASYMVIFEGTSIFRQAGRETRDVSMIILVSAAPGAAPSWRYQPSRPRPTIEWPVPPKPYIREALGWGRDGYLTVVSWAFHISPRARARGRRGRLDGKAGMQTVPGFLLTRNSPLSPGDYQHSTEGSSPHPPRQVMRKPGYSSSEEGWILAHTWGRTGLSSHLQMLVVGWSSTAMMVLRGKLCYSHSSACALYMLEMVCQ